MMPRHFRNTRFMMGFSGWALVSAFLCFGEASAVDLGKIISLQSVKGADGKSYFKVEHSGSQLQDQAGNPFPGTGAQWQAAVYVPDKGGDESASAWANLQLARDCQCQSLIPKAGAGVGTIIAGVNSVRLDDYSLEAPGDLGYIKSLGLSKGRNGLDYIVVEHFDNRLQTTPSSNITSAGEREYRPVYLSRPADELTFLATWSLFQQSQACQCTRLVPLKGAVDFEILPLQPHPDSVEAAKGIKVPAPAIRLDEYRFEKMW